jgi:hypothetical protein
MMLQWKDGRTAMAILAGMTMGAAVVVGGCGIKTNIGSAIDDDATGDDDTGLDDDSTQGFPTGGGCTEGSTNCIDGTEDGRPFGAITTSVFSASDDGNPTGDVSYNPLIVLADYAWTCEQLQSRPPTGNRIPYTEDEDTVVGVGNLLLGRYDATLGGMLGATETGTYQIVTSASRPGVEDGALIALASVYFMNNAGTVEVIDDATDGTVTIDQEDITKYIWGSFSMKTGNGETFSGTFSVTRCDFPPYDGGSGN